jgi:hypothetical protein
LQSQYDRDFREKYGPVLLPIVRLAAGLVSGVILAMVGITIAWSLYIFFGASSINTWLICLYISTGFGTAVASFVAWLHFDQENGWVLLLIFGVALGAGILGTWGGYEYGSALEIECCAEPTKGPAFYGAIGSTLAANASGLGVAIVRAVLKRKRRTQIHNAVH